MELAFLPTFDLEEIRNEILRFKPRLVTCRADILLRLLSSLPRRSASLDTSLRGSMPAKDLCAALVTPREKRVLAMLVQGKSNPEMARELRLSPRTVKRTLSDLFERFGASNRTELTHRTTRLCLLKKEC